MDGRSSKDFAALAPKVADMYQGGASLGEIARAFGKGIATISRWLDQIGVEKRDAGSGTRGKPWSDARRAATPAPAPAMRPVVDGMELRGAEIVTHRAIGNKSVRANGYVLVQVGRRARKYEHIVVAERALGRELRAGEVVHHINCDRTDNRPENLLICQIGYHIQLHARMRRHPYWSQF